jgi:branched-subunit amino acid aminotransferase/4-amino-4-deoxychorismate lyase
LVYLQPGSISNVFLVKDGRLPIPPTPQELREHKAAADAAPYSKSAVLPGVTRAAVIELAAGGKGSKSVGPPWT